MNDFDMYADAVVGVKFISQNMLIVFGRTPTVEEVVESLKDALVKDAEDGIAKLIKDRGYNKEAFVTMVHSIANEMFGHEVLN